MYVCDYCQNEIQVLEGVEFCNYCNIVLSEDEVNFIDNDEDDGEASDEGKVYTYPEKQSKGE